MRARGVGATNVGQAYTLPGKPDRDRAFSSDYPPKTHCPYSKTGTLTSLSMYSISHVCPTVSDPSDRDRLIDGVFQTFTRLE